MTQPPSFEPRKRRSRPSSAGARRVGRPDSLSENSARPRQSAPRPTKAPRIEPVRRTPARPDADHSVSSSQAPQRRTPAGPIRKSAFSHPNQQYQACPDDPAESNQPPRFPAQRPVQPPPHTPERHAPHTPLIAPAQRRRSVKYYARMAGIAALCCVLAVGGWVYYLFSYGNSQVTRISALTGAEGTPGTTYLIVGSDERGGIVSDPTEGHRADTIMLLHVPDSGSTSLISIPRDTLVDYPDGSSGKINASLNIGGHQALVGTVEKLTGLTVDHYVQIGMDGVKELTDAVGGVNLCLDYDVNDEFSGLVWQAGCHDVDGTKALAFSRMRYQDPLGDIGRTARQRQVVSKIIGKAASTSTFLNPFTQHSLVGSAASVLTVDNEDSLMDVAWAGLALRGAIGPDGMMGAPPISSLNYVGYDGASYVLLDSDKIDAFWEHVRNGTVTKDMFASF